MRDTTDCVDDALGIDDDSEFAPRQHPLRWANRPPSGRYVLGDALGIDAERATGTDAFVNEMVNDGASLRDVVSALSAREMTDAEFATAMYSLGWFDCQMRGPESDT